MHARSDLVRRALLLGALAFAASAFAQADGKACVAVLLHGKGGSAQSLATLAKRLQPACGARSPEMPWSARRAQDGDGAAALAEIAAQVKTLRQQGVKQVVLVGQGLGANAAIAYAGNRGDADAIVALGGDTADNAGGLAALPALTPKLPQYMPLLWLVGSNDPLRERGEGFAFAKAPPHPSSRFQLLKSDVGRTPEAAGGTVLEWIKQLQ